MVGRKKKAAQSKRPRESRALEARRPGRNRPRAQAERIAALWLAQEAGKRRAVVREKDKKDKKRRRDDAAAAAKSEGKRARRSATTSKMPVPPPTSSVPAQGGIASAAVEAEMRMINKIAMLMGAVDTVRRTPGLRLTAEDKEQLRTVFIVDFSNLDAVRAELGSRLKMSHTSLVLVMQEQVPRVCWLYTCVVDA